MKKILTVNGGILAAAIGKLNYIRQGRSNSVLPILDDIHMKTVKGGLILQATNLETFGTTGIVASVDQVGFEMTLVSNAIALVKEFAADTIEIWADPATREMKMISKIGESQFIYDNPNDFPKFPEVEETNTFVLGAPQDTISILQLASKFTSQDDLRPQLQGIMFRNDAIYGTDAHRLFRCQVKCTHNEFAALLRQGFVASLSGLNTKDPVTVKEGALFISLNDKSTKFITRKIDANAPAYDAVLPEKSTRTISVPRDDFKNNIRIALNLTNKSTNQIVLDCAKDKYVLTAGDLDFQQSVRIEGACHVDGDPILFGINGKFLYSVLDLLDKERVTIHINAENKPIVIHEDNYTFLVMPLAIKDDK